MKSKILSRGDDLPDEQPEWRIPTGIDSVSKSWLCCCRGIFSSCLLGLLLLVGFVAEAQSIRGIVPVQQPPGGSGVDGDAWANFSAVPDVVGPGVGDLFCNPAYPGTGGCVVNNLTGLPFDPTRTFVILDRYENDLSIFTLSNKIDDDPNTYTWGPGQNPNKNEIQNAGAHFAYGDPAIQSTVNGVPGPYGNPNDLWVLFAGDRQVTNGSSYIDFEFLQKPLTMTGAIMGTNPFEIAGGSGGFVSEGIHGGRTLGDILVTIEFDQGGGEANIFIRIWEQVGTGYEYVIHPNSEFFGEVFITNNVVETEVPYDVYGTQPGTYAVNQWAEGAVNLTQIFNQTGPEDPCGRVSTMFVRTRSSGSSQTSELKDFPGAPVQLSLCTDTQPPVFAEVPGNITVECPAPPPGPLSYTDNCIDPGEVMGVDTPNLNECGLGTITRTWTISDCGGNVATATQIITVVDSTGPIFEQEPADATYQCRDDVPAPGNLNYTDNCGQPGSVLGVDVSDGNTCPEVITRTWSITDCGGNIVSVDQIITVDDTTAPVFAQDPADATYQCIGDVPAPGNLAYTDNCDDAGEVLGVDVSDGNTCPETITRTWSFTDACGNAASVSQTITVDDTTAPVFAQEPADATYQCIDDVPAPGNLGYTDNCDDAGSVLGVDVSDGNTCPETITRTWSFTDACGNAASVSQTITVDDTTAPVFAQDPADATYQCIDDVPAPGNLAYTDNCDDAGEVLGVDVSDGNTCPETITRTWSFTDACGNAASVSQTITVDDTTAPVFAQDPADATYQCIDDVPAPGNLGYTDNCDDAGSVLGVDVSDGNTCPETITRTWSFTDACGNAASVSQTITVDDTTAPVFAQDPADATYQCIDDVPAPGNLAYTDNCDDAGEVLGVDVSDGNTCPETITRTWSFTDACGNAASVSQTITVDDTTAPVFAQEPADATYQCIDDVPAPGNLGYTDNCDDAGEVLGVDVSDGNTCPETITRTWSFTDACGNAASVSQTITVDDTTAPVFAQEPADATYQCIDDVPAPGNLGYTDNCDDAGEVLGVDVSDGNTCPETITRTWSFTDACGNAASVSQTITVDDTTAPVFAQEPADATYQCIDDVPAPGNLGYTDNCDDAGSVLGVDVSDGNTCPETITRTWSFTDACGNAASVSQTITVDDTTAPVFAQDPADATYQCIDDVPAPGNLGYTDNCDDAGEVLGVDVSDGNTCPETITRTWSFTDACGNAASVSQTITVDDTTAPVFAQDPADATYQCIDDVPAPGNLGYTDNCDDAGEVLGVDVSDGNTCPETITRTWSFTDACGNAASVSQTITVDDTTAPVFAQEPADATYQCIDDVPAPGNLGYTDNCDDAGEVLGVDVSDGNTCPETITRTWSFTDACGNAASVSQTITVDDTTAPVFAQDPADATYQCIDDVPAPGNLGYTDNCDDAGEVLGVDVSDGNTCPETITRTWSFTDACGNAASVSQTITVDDTTAPVFAQDPADATYQCIDDVPAPGNLGYTDNCDDAGEVLGVDVSDGNTCPETITRTWSFTDACGNAASVSQTITVDDTTAPVFAQDPADATYQCIDDVPAPGNLGYTDNCNDAGEVLGVDVSDGNTCPETITRTWSFTDACGNAASVSQTITVDDTTAPVFAQDPADATYQCIDDVPAPGNLGYTDNCDDAGEVLGVDVSDGNTCPETITRTWSFTDACGNAASVSQTITVDDTTAPVFAQDPADATYQCIDDVPAPGNLGYTDNCDDAGEVLGVDVSDGNTCPETITRTWSFTDACGNAASVSQTITVDDTTAPVFAQEPADATYQCIGDVPAPGNLGYTDNCDDAGEVLGVDVSDGNTCPETITRTWSFTDACGNAASVSQTITVDDTTAPVFAQDPADATYQCIDDVPAPGNLGYTDNCDDAGEVLGVDVSDGNTCPETITRTWSFTDACGNAASVSQTITVDDTTAPVFAQDPADATYQCIDDVPAPGNLAYTDNCDDAGEVLGVDVSDGNTCPETITRTWSFTDACGNAASVSQTITVDDTTAPVFAQDPADATYQCIDDVPAPGNLGYTDNCDDAGEVLGVDVSDGNTCPETITRTWSFTDACGNAASVSQTITVDDTTAPVFAQEPADATYQCIDDVPAPGNLGYTDNCDDAGEVLGVDVSDGNTCPETITRTWSFTDACGNAASVSQTITVDDTTAPVFAQDPADATYQCIDDVPAPGNLAYTDNCDDAGEVLGVDVSDGNTCPETITRTWSFTDACGNAASVSQTITVDDTTAPVFAQDPADATYECIDDVPAPGNLAYTDNCDDAGEVLGVDVSDGNTCPETITRTWSFTDACGNAASVSQTITVDDTTAPVFAQDPADATYQCIDDVPAPGNLAYTDNCDDAGEVLGVDVSDGNTCPETITRTWSFTDACGNAASVSQTITVDDTTAPVFAQDPADATYQCIDDVPAPGNLAYTDNCDDAGEVLGVDVSDGNTCPETITRTWSFTDACGNAASVSQTITVDDTTAPVFAQDPADATYQCIDDVPAPGNLGYTDNCDDAGEVLGVDVSDGNTCPETITRTWSFTDACGNAASVSQTITVDDTTAPVFAQEPADATYQCIDDVPAPGNLGYTDNCDDAGEVLGVDVSDGNTCPETITRTWSFTDACGNAASVSQTITVDDTTAPVFAQEPADATYQCIDDVPAPGNLGYTDNCDDAGEVLGVDVSDGNTCPETITRTWSFTDACGNAASVSQTITVDDTTAPVFAQDPADATYQCIGDVPAPGNLGYTDNCDDAGEVLGVDVSDGNTCPETITRTWSFTDACGNAASVSQTITVDDTTAPVFAQEPADATYQCIDDVPAPGNLGYTDNCDDAGSVLGVDVSDGNTCPETITRTWSFTDACGNAASVSQTITVDDTTAPVFAQDPADATYQCIDDVPAPGNLGYTDNCDDAGSVLGVDVSDGNTCPETITRTWSFTDACGNAASVSQTITVDDTTAPVFAQDPADATYQCIDDVPAPGNLGYTDNCDDAGEVLGVDVSDGNTCPETITRTWSFTDACGNAASVSQTITVDDTIAPVFNVDPADQTIDCGVTPVFGTPHATDNCDENPIINDLGIVVVINPDGTVTHTQSWTATDACGNVSAAISQIITVLACNEGCTLGYWKNHTDRWCSSYTPSMTFGSVFVNAPSNLANLTLLEALNARGGGIYNLARQGVAALLNACSDEVDYPAPYLDNPQAVIDAVNAAFLAGGNAPGQLATQLDDLNNSGCPLGGTPADSSGVSGNTTPAASFTAYPVPFKEYIIIRYDFNERTKARIEFYDAKGMFLMSYEDTDAYFNKEVKVDITFNHGEGQMFFVKVITEKGVTTKKVISKN